jgi:hypothetical protein
MYTTFTSRTIAKVVKGMLMTRERERERAINNVHKNLHGEFAVGFFLWHTKVGPSHIVSDFCGVRPFG